MFESIGKFFKKFRSIKQIDDTSSMERVGRDEYKYIEGDYALTLQIEMLSGTPRRIIYSRTINKWSPPHDSEMISDEKRRQILEKICKYFDNNGISYIIQ